MVNKHFFTNSNSYSIEDKIALNLKGNNEILELIFYAITSSFVNFFLFLFQGKSNLAPAVGFSEAVSFFNWGSLASNADIIPTMAEVFPVPGGPCTRSV